MMTIFDYLTNAKSSVALYMLLYAALIFAVWHLLLIMIVFLKFRFFEYHKILKNSCFYCGRVKHTRLKGGAVHHLDYPIFFASGELLANRYIKGRLEEN
jgi:hypothetical protein